MRKEGREGCRRQGRGGRRGEGKKRREVGKGGKGREGHNQVQDSLHLPNVLYFCLP